MQDNFPGWHHQIGAMVANNLEKVEGGGGIRTDDKGIIVDCNWW